MQETPTTEGHPANAHAQGRCQSVPTGGRLVVIVPVASAAMVFVGLVVADHPVADRLGQAVRAEKLQLVDSLRSVVGTGKPDRDRSSSPPPTGRCA